MALADVAGDTAYVFDGVSGPSIFLVHAGEGRVDADDGFALSAGSVMFVAAGTPLPVKAGPAGLSIARYVRASLRESRQQLASDTDLGQNHMRVTNELRAMGESIWCGFIPIKHSGESTKMRKYRFIQ